MSSTAESAWVEQRGEQRIERNVGIFVHVEHCATNPEWVGKSIPCEATDFSPHGLRCRSDLEFSTGDIVNVSIGIGAPFAMYLLQGEVRWCQRMNHSDFDDLSQQPEGDYAMGLRLQDGARGDLGRWKESFDDNFRGSSENQD